MSWKNCGTYILYSNVANFKEQYLFLLYGWICKLASCFDWLPKQGRRAHLACFEFPTLVLQQKGFFWPYNLILYWHSLFGQEEWILAFMLIILCQWPCKLIIYYHITVIFARLLQNIYFFVNSTAVFSLDCISHYDSSCCKGQGVSFFLADKLSVPDIFSSCFFMPHTHFETSLVMVSCYGHDIWHHK